MALPARAKVTEGNARPRVAPPMPASSALAEYEAAAARMGIELMPWQRIAARYMTALAPGRSRRASARGWLYREFCAVVARQNGKTHLLIPRVLMGLQRGETILHTAQDRQIPRKTFVREIMPRLARSGIEHKVRIANGQEEITTPEGGHYRIVAPNASSRGETADLVIIDEVREQRDQDVMDAMLPTITARENAQVIYMSNAGDDESVVLNELRRRGDEGDRGIAYLEWSAAPQRPIDDRDGWLEANPALGHAISWPTLEHFYASRPSASFETEHLCRWVDTMLSRVVPDVLWERGRGEIGTPTRPYAGLAQDPAGRRVSAAIAWQTDTGVDGYVVADIDGQPLDVEAAAERIEPALRQLGVREIRYDPWTDRDIARHFKTAKPIQQAEWEAACLRFTQDVEAGRVRYRDHDGRLTIDMGRTVQKPTAHAWFAVPASSEQPVTASLAFIRAHWLATNPTPTPRVY